MLSFTVHFGLLTISFLYARVTTQYPYIRYTVYRIAIVHSYSYNIPASKVAQLQCWARESGKI